MHTSGFGNKKFTPKYRGDAMLRAMLAASPHDEPGSRYQYSCLNFILLSLLVEDVTGQPFSTFCDKSDLRPFGNEGHAIWPRAGV